MDNPTESGTEHDRHGAGSGGTDATGVGRKERLLDRRTLLKVAGATALGGLFAVGTGQASGMEVVEKTQEDGYEKWRVPAGETVVVNLADGDSVENVLVDQTASGANLYIVASGNPSNWTIRNVGWDGVGYTSDVDGWGGRFHMLVTGDGLVENVFVDDRTTGTRTQIGGILAPRPHGGTIEVRNTYIAGCGNNAVYASGPGKDGGNEGVMRLFNCYHRDNTVAQFRIGTPGSLVENCVGVVNDPDGLRGHYPNTDSQRARGIWCRNMVDNTVRNSVMYIDPDDADPYVNYMVEHFSKSIGDEAVLNLETVSGNSDALDMTMTRSRDGPARFVGEVDSDSLTTSVIGDGGVPTSPLMAARGEREMPPEIPGVDTNATVSTDSPSDVTDTAATLNGSLGSLGGASSADVGFEWRASGASEWNSLAAGTLSSTGSFSASLSSLAAGTTYEFRAVASASDGDSATASTVAFTSGSGTTLDRTLTVDGTETDRTDYTFTVSEDLAENPDTGGLGTGDSIDGSTATGFVNGGIDGYLFSGEVTDITVEGNADIIVDGEVVDPANLGDTDPAVSTDAASAVSGTQATLAGSLDSLGEASSADVGFEWRAVGASDWNAVVVETRSTTGSFSATVSDLVASTDYEYRATVLASDGDTATGSAAGFTTATASNLDRTLTVDGTSADRTDYTFTVSGDLAENPDTGGLGTGDSIDGSTASGFVNGGIDGYLFSGEVTDIAVEGNADILVDGEVVDPDTLVLPNTIVIHGDGSSNETTYSFQVTGDLVNDEGLGPIESSDDLSGSSATGTVVGDDQDTFRFSGGLVTLELDGDGSVSFEDNDG